MRLYWEGTNIASTDLDLEIARDERDQFLLRLDTTSKDPAISYLSDTASKSGEPIELEYDPDSKSQETAVAVELLDKTSDYITTELNHILRDESRMAHVSPVLQEALSNFEKIVPTGLCITGYRGSILCYYRIVRNE